MTDSPRAPFRPSRRALVILILLALATRLLWVLWLHPPTAFVYSDMGGYVKRAVDLAEQGFVPGTRHLAWQAYGTHYLLGAILKIIGTQYLYAAGLFWGLMGAAAVPRRPSSKGARMRSPAASSVWASAMAATRPSLDSIAM